MARFLTDKTGPTRSSFGKYTAIFPENSKQTNSTGEIFFSAPVVTCFATLSPKRSERPLSPIWIGFIYALRTWGTVVSLPNALDDNLN